MSINYTLVTSCIAAAASLASAGIAFFSKERDFKNDYYKKIIEKRFKVYQDVEAVLYTLRGTNTQVSTGKKYPTSFANEQRLVSLKKLVLDPVFEGFWLSEGLRSEMIDLNSLLGRVFKEARELEDRYQPGEEEDYEVFQSSIYQELGVKYYSEITVLSLGISVFFRKDLSEIHKVEKYLKHIVKRGESSMREYQAKQATQQK